jgi:uncharacterized membrane protein YiaA
MAFLISGVLAFLVMLWENINGTVYYLSGMIMEDSWELVSIPIGFILSAILSLLAIINFKNRKLQIKLNRFNLVTNLYLLGIIVYLLLSLSGENFISEKGIGLFLPVIVIVLLVLANKATQKDEELVKSVDRLR